MMKAKLGKAVPTLFGKSSLEMVYFEAIANSLDAGATVININVSARSLQETQSIKINIGDNGEGFTDSRYAKFSCLFDVDQDDHKGLGRLVYLCYFDSVKIDSYYDRTKKRSFEFTTEFDENKCLVEEITDHEAGTNIAMSGYKLERLHTHAYVQADAVANRVTQEFYARLFKLRMDDVHVIINIKSTIEDVVSERCVSNSDFPAFKSTTLQSTLDAFEKFELHYSINYAEPKDTSIISAISVDTRTVNVDLIAKENLPTGYKIVLLLFSNWFQGKSEVTRERLAVSDSEMNILQAEFRTKAKEVLEAEIPIVKTRNADTLSVLEDRFPHLNGYFCREDVGYISRNDVIRKAQDSFFRAQKDILDASELTDEQYESSIEMSARALAEYIIFRQKTIDKLASMTSAAAESELHQLFAVMRSEYIGGNAPRDRYRNNAWLLDDKYMTYDAVLSDREMSDLIRVITDGEAIERDSDRPDLAFVFSASPNAGKKVDVVIVELKRRGLSVEDNMRTVTQLEKRARKLISYYSNNIQRMWYYGIVEINEDMALHLSGEFQELYSLGTMFYREIPIAVQREPLVKVPIGVFMWDIDSVIKDANARNSAFLSIFRDKYSVSESKTASL